MVCQGLRSTVQFLIVKLWANRAGEAFEIHFIPLHLYLDSLCVDDILGRLPKCCPISWRVKPLAVAPALASIHLAWKEKGRGAHQLRALRVDGRDGNSCCNHAGLPPCPRGQALQTLQSFDHVGLLITPSPRSNFCGQL